MQTAGRRQDNRRSRAADWVFQGIWLEADAEEHIRRAIKVRKNPSAADAEETQKGVQQTEQPRKRETAKKAEILSFLTEVMRDEEEADLKTRMKAAELLGKRESLFEKKTPTEKESRVIIVDDLP